MTFSNRPMRSISHSSAINSPNAVPSTSIPATPTNTPVTTFSSSTFAAVSPVCLAPVNTSVTGINSPEGARTPLPIPPMNTPASSVDSGVGSPQDGGVSLGAHPPVLLEAHHFESPMLSPTVPPNSPESWPFQVATDEDAKSGFHDDHQTSLGERLAALGLSAGSKVESPKDEVKEPEDTVARALETEYYKVLPIPGKGYGCIALKSIKRGTRILADSPLLILEKAHYFHADIQAEFDKLSPADKKLYFTLHSAHNQDPSSWPRKIADSVTDRESKRIEEQHNARVGKEPTLISIFQTNCMEKDGGAAVFPNAARFNHSCNPNACFTWNSAIGKETIHTMKDIKADEEITLGYCDTTHDKATRRWELKHYGFFCDCLACTGDESDPDSFAAKSAARRFRLMELEQEMEPLRGVFLELGAKKEGFVNQLLELAKLLIEEGDYTARLAATYLDIALICEVKGDLAFAKVAAQKALQVCIDSQGRDFLDVPKYESVVKRIKEKMDMEGEMNGSIEKK